MDSYKPSHKKKSQCMECAKCEGMWRSISLIFTDFKEQCYTSLSTQNQSPVWIYSNISCFHARLPPQQMRQWCHRQVASHAQRTLLLRMSDAYDSEDGILPDKRLASLYQDPRSQITAGNNLRCHKPKSIIPLVS